MPCGSTTSSAWCSRRWIDALPLARAAQRGARQQARRIERRQRRIGVAHDRAGSRCSRALPRRSLPVLQPADDPLEVRDRLRPEYAVDQLVHDDAIDLVALGRRPGARHSSPRASSFSGYTSLSTSQRVPCTPRRGSRARPLRRRPPRRYAARAAASAAAHAASPGGSCCPDRSGSRRRSSPACWPTTSISSPTPCQSPR